MISRIVTTKTASVINFAALFRFQSNQSHVLNFAQKTSSQSSFSSSGFRILLKSVNLLKFVTRIVGSYSEEKERREMIDVRFD